MKRLIILGSIVLAGLAATAVAPAGTPLFAPQDTCACGNGGGSFDYHAADVFVPGMPPQWAYYNVWLGWHGH